MSEAGPSCNKRARSPADENASPPPSKKCASDALVGEDALDAGDRMLADNLAAFLRSEQLAAAVSAINAAIARREERIWVHLDLREPVQSALDAAEAWRTSQPEYLQVKLWPHALLECMRPLLHVHDVGAVFRAASFVNGGLQLGMVYLVALDECPEERKKKRLLEPVGYPGEEPAAALERVRSWPLVDRVLHGFLAWSEADHMRTNREVEGFSARVTLEGNRRPASINSLFSYAPWSERTVPATIGPDEDNMMILGLLMSAFCGSSGTNTLTNIILEQADPESGMVVQLNRTKAAVPVSSFCNHFRTSCLYRYSAPQVGFVTGLYWQDFLRIQQLLHSTSHVLCPYTGAVVSAGSAAADVDVGVVPAMRAEHRARVRAAEEGKVAELEAAVQAECDAARCAVYIKGDMGELDPLKYVEWVLSADNNTLFVQKSITRVAGVEGDSLDLTDADAQPYQYINTSRVDYLGKEFLVATTTTKVSQLHAQTAKAGPGEPARFCEFAKEHLRFLHEHRSHNFVSMDDVEGFANLLRLQVARSSGV